MEQTIKCEEHTPIILNTEHIDDQLLEKVNDIQETKENEKLSDEQSNSNQKKQKRSEDIESKTNTDESSGSTKRSSDVTLSNTNSGPNTRSPQYTLKHDGDYLFVIHIGGSSFQAEVELEMKGSTCKSYKT